MIRLALRRLARRLLSRGVIAVPVVVVAVAGSLLIARHLDPILRQVAPAVAPPQRIALNDPAGPAEPPIASAPAPAASPRPAVERLATAPAAVPAPPARPAAADANDDDDAEEEADAERDEPRPARNQRSARQRLAAHRLRGASANAGEPATGLSGFGSYALVAEARRYIGTNPTTMARLWCARFMNFVLDRSGYRGTGSDAALSFARYGRRISGPRVGAIAVMRRKGGGHVGVVSGIDRHGNPIIISGNSIVNGRRTVAETVYSRKRILAYVIPHR
jgi:uncharacterized protein (TIGR02594 family)